MARTFLLLLLGAAFLIGCNRTPDAPDVNPCGPGHHDCDVNAACTADETNDAGYVCTCEGGYTGDGTECLDLDECDLGTHDCDPNATCTNEVGGFGCVCNAGFVGLGWTCTDIDECDAGTFSCDPNAVCINTPGTYACSCRGGFDGPGTSCNPYPIVVVEEPLDGTEIPFCPVSEPGCVDTVTISGQVVGNCADAVCDSNCAVVTGDHNGADLGAQNCAATSTFSWDVDVAQLSPGANRFTVSAQDTY